MKVAEGLMLLMLFVGLPLVRQTLAETPADVARRMIHISPGGDDTATGGATTPRGSIQLAVDAALPGDVIRLLPGVHAGPVVLKRGGEYGRPVTLDGADGAILAGHTPFIAEWKPMPDIGPHVYSTPVPFPVGHVVADGQTVAMLNERRIGATASDPVPRWMEIFRNGIRDRWDGVGGLAMYRGEKKDLLVRFADGRDPRESEILCTPRGAHGIAIRIENADRVVIRGLEIRNARIGIFIQNSTGSVVEQCRIGRTRDGIVLSSGSDRCTLRFNTITQDPLGVNHGVNRATPEGQFNDPQWKRAWDLWIAHKDFGFYDSRAINIDRTLGGHRVHDNHIHDHWDGISTRHWESWNAPAADRLAASIYNPDLDIHHNRIERMNDDALEPNDGGVNQRWHHNVVRHARCGLRLKAIDKGPAYFYANQFQDNEEDIRCYGELDLNAAEIHVYHNSGNARRALNSNRIRESVRRTITSRTTCSGPRPGGGISTPMRPTGRPTTTSMFAVAIWTRGTRSVIRPPLRAWIGTVAGSKRMARRPISVPIPAIMVWLKTARRAVQGRVRPIWRSGLSGRCLVWRHLREHLESWMPGLCRIGRWCRAFLVRRRRLMSNRRGIGQPRRNEGYL